MQTASFAAYWYLHVPSWILAALILLLLGRLALMPLISPSSAIMRALAAITHPVIATVGAMTPRIVPPAAVMAFAVAWLAAARLVVLWVAMAMGVRL